MYMSINDGPLARVVVVKTQTMHAHWQLCFPRGDFVSVAVRSSRMIEIQSQMSERAVELLSLPEDQPCFLLDVG